MRRLIFILFIFVHVTSAAEPQPQGLTQPQPIATSQMKSAPMPGAPSFLKVPAEGPLIPPKPSIGTGAVDYKRFRDPFKEPVYIESQITKSELERYSVTDFKVTGIITGPVRMRAMLLAPDGKTHYVSEKMKLGLRDGVIVKITTKTIVVREKVVNPLGEVELFDTEIGMDQAANANNNF